MRIGFFDSGIGGLSVLSEALTVLPDEEYLFDADIDHVPYGERSAEEIAHYAMDNARFLLSEGAQAIVVACNTATAVAIGQLRGMTDVPVIGMEPAVKPAVEGIADGAEESSPDGACRDHRVLVAATPVTLRENKLKDLIRRVDPMHRVDAVPLPGLVPRAEAEAFDSPETEAYLTEAFAGIDPGAYCAFVMGCTHFTYFKPLFRKLLGPQVRLIDGNAGTVRHLADVLGLPKRRTALSPGLPDNVRCYLSGRRVTDPAELARFGRYLDRMEKIREI